MLAALGDYADAADPDLLTARTFDAHPTGTADLFGLRLAVLHESDTGRRLAEGTVKRLTGGDRIKARRMREDFWSFDPSHTFLMLTNHKPIVTGTDEGIWRRLRLVPWDVVIPADERDEGLGDAARAGTRRGARLARGRLRRLAAARAGRPASRYRGDGRVPGRVRRARPVHRPAVPDRPGLSRPLVRAVRRLVKWCAEEGEDPGTQTAFSRELINRGFDKRATKIGKVWDGLGLAGTDDEGTG